MNEWIQNNLALFIALIVLAVLLVAGVIVWVAGYHTIRFETCGGKPVKTIVRRRSQLVIMPTTTKEGSVFGGWYFDKACTRPAVIATMPRESVTVYAKWNVIVSGVPAYPMQDAFRPEGAAAAPMALPGHTPPKPKSFLKQLKASSNFNKSVMEELCIYFYGFAGVRVRFTRREALFKSRQGELLRAQLSGNTLKLFYALEPEAYDANIYHHKRSDKKWAKETPFLLTVRSARSRKYAARLAEEVAAQKGLKRKKQYEPADYRTYILAQGGNALTRAGKAELIAERINVQDAGVLSDREAREMLEYKTIAPLPEGGKVEVVNIGTLSEHFADGTRVDLNALKRKKLVDEDAVAYRVVGKNTLERSLCVIANGFNAGAVKMLLLTGGRAVLLKEAQEEPSAAPQEAVAQEAAAANA